VETVKSPADQRIVVHNVSWETYQRLLEERGEDRVPRFVYDRGELEIMSPSAEHERVEILLLRARGYERSNTSLALPSVTVEALRILVQNSASLELAEWLDMVIERAQENPEPSG
jgi:Uma2 family endonuclease